MDRPKKGRREHNSCQNIYQEAFEPFHTHKGTQYYCTQSQLDFHRRGKFPHPNKGPFVSAIEATTEIVWHNKETRKIPPLETAAIERLIDAILDAEEYGYSPDLIVKAFADLDVVFFNGKFRDNVYVQWASDEYFQRSKVPAGTWGFTVRPKPGEVGQCRIKLNAKTILVDPSTDTSFKTMFGTMLHEMCHAYEFVRCLAKDCDPGDGHDEYFRTRIHAVHRRAWHLLGLWAIDKRESYRKDHLMSQDWDKEWRDTKDKQRQSSKHGQSKVRGKYTKKDRDSKVRKKGECSIM